MTKKILAALLALLFLVLFAGAMWLLFFGGLEALTPIGAPLSPPAAVSGPVRGMFLPASAVPAQPQDLLREAVGFAAENGFNTLYFEARQGQQVLWKDGTFPQQGEDALSTLSALCAEKNVALWLVMDPYAADNAPEKNALSDRYPQEAGSFSPEDEAYRKLVTDSLRRAAAAYPINGVLFTQDPDGLLCGALREAGVTVGVWSSDASPYSMVRAPKEQDMVQSLNGGAQAPIWDLRGADPAVFGPLLSEAAAREGFAGAVTVNYPASFENLRAQALTAALAAPAKAAPGFALPSALSVGYPAKDERIYTAQCFIMGSSDPEKPLLLDGQEVPRYGTQGVFGILVSLEMGENHFVFAQGDETLEYTVTRAQGAAAKAPVRDATQELEPGAAIEVTSWLCSVLSDPADDGSIVNTLPQGARLTVASSREVRRGSQLTTAYQLESGGYVLAWYVKEIPAQAAVLSGPTVSSDEKGELLSFAGGQPAALTSREGNVLRLLFYGAKADAFSLPESAFVESIQAQDTDEGLDVRLTLKEPEKLWGYQLGYDGEQTLLYLKRAPVLSGDYAAPLKGVTVMVDAGHGGADTGALTPAGPNNEKEVNLALAQAIGARLRQLGATVIETRTGDDQVSLEERSRLFASEKPDFFIAVHHNSILLNGDANAAEGVECYYFDEQLSKPFAQKLTALVGAATARKTRGVFWDYFYVTRSTLAPSVLFEYGFLPNPAEFEDCFSQEGLNAAAYATARGVLEMVPQNP
ncbi:MAG: N-acetylmuramoyl-L-alanine amidase [Oscillospiraceae bacterium]|nr:N-acetylmuramoyl-L-alanine amidase [Oscillospiraceae bacterium]